MRPVSTQQPDYVHPTFAGDQTGGTGVSPAGWLVDNIRAWWNANIATNSRGFPAPLGPRDRRPIGQSYKQPPPFGNFSLLLTRRFDRGADAYGYRFGAMSYDPIGPGVVTTRPFYAALPAANELPFGIGITWRPQPINYGITPLSGGGPLYDPQTAAALMRNEALAGAIPQGVYIAPPENGFGG
jgi:hypothetical protein